MSAYGQKLVKCCTHTHAAKLVVRIPRICNSAVGLMYDLTDTCDRIYVNVLNVYCKEY